MTKRKPLSELLEKQIREDPEFAIALLKEYDEELKLYGALWRASKGIEELLENNKLQRNIDNDHNVDIFIKECTDLCNKLKAFQGAMNALEGQ